MNDAKQLAIMSSMATIPIQVYLNTKRITYYSLLELKKRHFKYRMLRHIGKMHKK